ncbi:MAG: inorganic diphosphatase [Pyrodictiaceae archaeon]
MTSIHDRIGPGSKVPEEVYVLVEIPMGSDVKYEFDEEKEVIMVDRFLYTAMHYPFNYGFIPGTLEEDGDPLDVLVISNRPVLPGSIIRVRPIGLLVMEDEEGIDNKVIAVPVEKLDPSFAKIKDVADLPDSILNKIKHFFEHYKELEPGKWVKVHEWKGAEEAKRRIREAVERYRKGKRS